MGSVDILLKDNRGYLTLVDFFSLYYSRTNTKFTHELKVKLDDNTEIETGSLFNIYRSYYKILRDFYRPVFCFDYRTTKYNIRYKKSESYKKKRHERNKRNINFKRAYNYLKIFLRTIPYAGFYYTGLEGDDIIYSITQYYINNINDLRKRFRGIIILTVDSDLWYLIKYNNVYIYDLKGYERIDIERIRKKFGVINPHIIPLIKILKGDQSDNIYSSLKPNKGSYIYKTIIELSNKSRYEDFDIYNYKTPDDIILKIKTILKISNIEEYIDVDKFKLNYELVKMIYIDINDIEYSIYKGNERYYNVICKELKFNKVPKFNQYYDIFKTKIIDTMRIIKPYINIKDIEEGKGKRIMLF